MDNFLAKLHHEKVIFPHNYLYLLGITSVYIAAKFEEIDMVPIEIIVKDLGHNKFTKAEVMAMEIKILQTLNFKIPRNSSYDEAHILLKKILL